MAKELGIGVRVWVKFNPRIREGMRCRTGTIVDGPTDAGTEQVDPAGRPFRLNETSWGVRLDGEDADPAAYKESDLSPIDDGDPTAEPERADRPEEVGA